MCKSICLFGLYSMESICGYIDLYLFAASVQCLKLDYFLKFSCLGRFGKMLAVIKCRVFCIGNRYYLPGSSNSYFSSKNYMVLSVGFNPDPQRIDFTICMITEFGK